MILPTPNHISKLPPATIASSSTKILPYVSTVPIVFGMLNYFKTVIKQVTIRATPTIAIANKCELHKLNINYVFYNVQLKEVICKIKVTNSYLILTVDLIESILIIELLSWKILKW